jgi:hypothetical protein
VAGSECGLLIDQKRRRQLGVAVLTRVQVQHHIDQAALESGPQTDKEREAAARDFDAARQIENAELLPQFPVWLGLEFESTLLTPSAH